MVSRTASTGSKFLHFEDSSKVPQLMSAFIAGLVIANSGVALLLVSRKLEGTTIKTHHWLIMCSLLCLEIPVACILS